MAERCDMGRGMKAGRNVRSKGGKGSGMKEMHHSPAGTKKGFLASKHPKKLHLKHQDPMV